MKATIYEALGIPQTASDEEVRTSLRRLIRKYYARTRDGQGNVEEALRFINHASRILTDPARRARYDRELALSGAPTEDRIAHVVSHAVGATGAGASSAPPSAAVSTSAAGSVPAASPAMAASEPRPVGAGLDPALVVERNLHHAGLTERLVSFHRSTLMTVALCTLFATFIVAAIVFVTPTDAVLVAKQVLVWLTLTLLGLALVYGVVHAVSWVRHRKAGAMAATAPPTDLAVLNWRREKSVFLGADQPQEDASWIFQLRMAELERAKSGRTSVPSPWSRLAARLFDYAIWGLVLALLFSELKGAGVIPEAWAFWIGHPLVAPIVITASWVLVETPLIASLQSTPGKWLFGVYVQFSISDAYARRDTPAQLARALRRAFRVWWQGVGCGFPLVAPVLIAIAYERVAQNQETDWDNAQDCLVTHGSPAVINVVTGVVGLSAMLWLYAVAWHQPMAQSMTWVHRAIVDALPAPPDLRRAGFPVGAGVIGGLRGALKGPPSGPTVPAPPPRGGSESAALIDPEIDAQFAERRATIAVLKVEGPRMLRAGNWRRASELCRTWTDLDLGNADAWRCLGQALQAQGYHQEAINAFRKAKQYDPADRTLDAAIDRSQKGIVADFLNRKGR
jgi:hypothetical protein